MGVRAESLEPTAINDSDMDEDSPCLIRLNRSDYNPNLQDSEHTLFT